MNQERIAEIELSLKVAKRIHEREKEKFELQQLIVFNGQKYIDQLESELYYLKFEVR